jgi:hypothetical protein
MREEQCGVREALIASSKLPIKITSVIVLPPVSIRLLPLRSHRSVVWGSKIMKHTFTFIIHRGRNIVTSR